MNREIKFRAWSKATEKMMDWEFIKVHGNFNKVLTLNHVEVMQFTGLTDKNGKEIYEGDILREPAKSDWDKINYSCYEVFFHDNDANLDYNVGFSISRMHNHGSVCGGFIPSFKPKQVSNMIVIGNILENPELLCN